MTGDDSFLRASEQNSECQQSGGEQQLHMHGASDPERGSQSNDQTIMSCSSVDTTSAYASNTKSTQLCGAERKGKEASSETTEDLTTTKVEDGQCSKEDLSTSEVEGGQLMQESGVDHASAHNCHMYALSEVNCNVQDEAYLNKNDSTSRYVLSDDTTPTVSVDDKSSVEEDQEIPLVEQVAAKEASLKNEIRLSKRLSQELEECKVQMRRKDCLLGEQLLAHEKLRRESEKMEKLLREQEKDLAEKQKLLEELRKQNEDLLARHLNQTQEVSRKAADFFTTDGNVYKQSFTEQVQLLVQHVRSEHHRFVSISKSDQFSACSSDQQPAVDEAVVHELNEELKEFKTAVECMSGWQLHSDNPFNSNMRCRKRLLLLPDRLPHHSSSTVTAEDNSESSLACHLKKRNSSLTVEVLECWQMALASAISEKDALIAEFEMQKRKKDSELDDVFITKLHQEKDELLRELKCQVPELLKLVSGSDEAEDDTLAQRASCQLAHHPLYHKSESELMSALQRIYEEQDELYSYIDELVACILEKQPHLLEAMPRLQVDRTSLNRSVCDMLLHIYNRKEEEHSRMKSYLDSLLQRIAGCSQDLLNSLPTLEAFTSECSDGDTSTT